MKIQVLMTAEEFEAMAVHEGRLIHSSYIEQAMEQAFAKVDLPNGDRIYLNCQVEIVTT